MKGRKQSDKEQIVAQIKEAARLYKQHLVGKTFLYVFDGRFIEVIYKTQNFRHLTGVDTDLPAKRFYQNAVNRTLQANQIWFSPQHPYQLCLRKVKQRYRRSRRPHALSWKRSGPNRGPINLARPTCTLPSA